MAVVAMRKDWPPTASRQHLPALHFKTVSRGISMGKSIALFFACAALVIIAGSFVAPTTVAARKDNCSPAYGIDPCATSSIPATN
jgi:hypothetical protein